MMAELAAPVLSVASAAPDRQHYLMQPDLGRRLAALRYFHRAAGHEAVGGVDRGVHRVGAGRLALHHVASLLGDLEALAPVLRDDVCVVVEPVQSEGGVIRVFPCWPAARDASFTLQAKGYAQDPG